MNWNLTGLINTSRTVVERYVYDPHGAVTYLTATCQRSPKCRQSEALTNAVGNPRPIRTPPP